MKAYRKSYINKVLLAIVAGGIAVSVFGMMLFPSIVSLVIIVSLGVVLTYFVLEVGKGQSEEFALLEKNVQRVSLDSYRQMEAYAALTNLVNPDHPIVGTRGWAASPDFLLEIANTILNTKPKLIVEASSGLSTVVSAYCLKKLGSGRVISMENDEKFADISRGLVKQHGLEEFAKVIHAPLINYKIQAGSYQWYDYEKAEIPEGVDLLIVDGPRGKLQTQARYPAVPLLIEKLASGCTVLLDDGGRPDEQKIADRWMLEENVECGEFLYFEKGAFKFQLK